MKKDRTTPQTVAGIDLGDKKHAVRVMDRAGKILRETSVTNTRAALERLCKEFPEALAAIGVGTHSPGPAACSRPADGACRWPSPES